MDGWIDRTCLHLLSLRAAPQHAAGSLQRNANSLGGRGSLRPFDGAFCCWRSGRKNPRPKPLEDFFWPEPWKAKVKKCICMHLWDTGIHIGMTCLHVVCIHKRKNISVNICIYYCLFICVLHMYIVI